MSIPAVLSIAGSDSGAGAGIQADLKTFAALGVYGCTAITAITAQNTLGVERVEVLSKEILFQQIKVVMQDFAIAAVKTGMIPTFELMQTVYEASLEFNFGREPNCFWVLDPVMVSESGHSLISKEAIDYLRRIVIARASLITPNLPELSVLLDRESPESIQEMIAAAQALIGLGAKAVLVKGGHRQGDPIDVLLEVDGTPHIFESVRQFTQATHGTGCTYASAIAALLARGYGLVDAVRISHNYLQDAIRNAQPMGHGKGPVNHFYKQSWNAHCAEKG